MKQLLKQYAAYNIWANKRITERISQLPDKQINKEIASSFPSLYKTILHMTDVESIWWQRIKLSEHVESPSKNFKGNFEELSKNLLKLSKQWEEWIDNTSEINLSHVFAYQNSKREHFKQPVYEVILQLFNHQTYHRGQIVTMFHHLAVDKIPPTDFIVFSRTKK